MALSPNIMVTQARKLMDEAKAARDESVSARDEAEAIYNKTQTLLAEIDKKEQNIRLLQEKTELESKATFANAAQARIFMNKTEEVYNKTQALSIEIEDNLRRIETTLQEARDYANTSAIVMLQPVMLQPSMPSRQAATCRYKLKIRRTRRRRQSLPSSLVF